MPKMPTLSADDQLRAQAVQMGLTPHADQLMKTLTQLTTDQTKWDAVMAQVEQKDRESLRKAILANNKMEVMYQIAKLNKEGRLGSAAMSAGASKYRSDTLRSLGEMSAEIKDRIAKGKDEQRALEVQLAAQTKIATSKESSSSQKKDANAQMQIIQSNLDMLKNRNADLLRLSKDTQDALTSATGSSGDTTGGTETDSIEELFNKYGLGTDLEDKE